MVTTAMWLIFGKWGMGACGLGGPRGIFPSSQDPDGGQDTKLQVSSEAVLPVFTPGSWHELTVAFSARPDSPPGFFPGGDVGSASVPGGRVDWKCAAVPSWLGPELGPWVVPTPGLGRCHCTDHVFPRERLVHELDTTGELLVDLGSDQTSCHNPFNGGYYPVQLSFEEAQSLMASNPAAFKGLVQER